jgi:ACS family hexuronate transporter-like MFS transporter
MTPADNGISMGRRWLLACLLSASIAINLIDRQVLNNLGPTLRANMHWSATQFSFIAVAFQVGMVAGQVPAGMFLDSVGTRIGLAAMLVLWSAVGAAHAVAASLVAFIVVRFFMGVAQCGNYGAGIKAIAGLFSAEKRSSAGGIFNAGAQMGTVIAVPLVLAVLLPAVGWRMTFVLPAAAGLIWLLPWLAIYPGKQASQAATGQKAGPTIGFARLLRNRKVVGLFLVRCCSGPLTTFYWVWLPQYLKIERKMPLAMIGLLGWLPYLAGATGNVAGGFISDRLVKAFGSVDRARKVGFTCAFLLSALSAAVPLAGSIPVALGIISLVLFGNQWVAATYIATVGDTFPAHVAGRVNGLAGFGDSGATLIAVLATGVVVDHFSYTPVFIAAGTLPLLAMASVFFVLRKIEPEPIAA